MTTRLWGYRQIEDTKAVVDREKGIIMCMTHTQPVKEYQDCHFQTPSMGTHAHGSDVPNTAAGTRAV